MDSIVLTTCLKPYKEKASIGMIWNPPPIGLAYIASYLRANGFKAHITDLNFAPFASLIKTIQDVKPLIVGLSVYSDEFSTAKSMIRAMKKRFPSLKFVIGGPHGTALPQESLEEIPDLDFVVIGEGEETALELMKILSNNTDSLPNLTQIAGLAFRGPDKKIFVNHPRDRIRDLDKLPFPAWDLLDLSKYNRAFMEVKPPFRHRLELLMLTQRGCPHHCIFCQKIFGSTVIPRSVKNVLEEIDFLVKQYHPNRIAFIDEIFCHNKARTIQLCREMAKREYEQKFTWACSTRVNEIDDEIMRAMKTGGCTRISMGIESGNPHILKIIRKGIQLDQAKQAVDIARKYGIKTHCGIIFGHPFETYQTLQDSLRASLDINPDLISFSLLTPFPGSDVFEMSKSHYGGLRLISNSGWSDYKKQMGKSLELTQLPFKFLKKWQFYSYLRFYLRPSRVREILNIVNVKAIPLFLIGVLRA